MATSNIQIRDSINKILLTAIGLGCVLSMTTKTVLSKLRGTTQALYILTSSNNARFEFIFTNIAIDNTRQFSSVFDIYRFVYTR